MPNALPYLFSALKIAASTAVIGAIVGEWIGSTKGIGALIIQSTYNFDSPLLYATIVVGSTFSALFFGVISLAERRLLRWNVDAATPDPLICQGGLHDLDPPVHRRAGRPRAGRRRRPTSSSSAAARPASPRRWPARATASRVTLLERYPYLGGLASGGMVLVLDDMCNGQEITVRGLCADLIDRMEQHGARRDAARGRSVGPMPRMWRKWSRWGVFDFTSHQKPQPIVLCRGLRPRRLQARVQRHDRRGQGQPAPA